MTRLILELLNKPECEWLEFKESNFSSETIGENISAIANSCALLEREYGYIVFGVADGTREIVGCEGRLAQHRVKGQQELENWLRTQLSPHVNFRIEDLVIDEKCLSIIRVSRALNTPVLFQREAYIRIGSNSKRLRENPSVESNLWGRLKGYNFEFSPAMSGLTLQQVRVLLDTDLFFDKLKLSLPSSEVVLQERLCNYHIIKQDDDGLYSITNLGAVLLARNLGDFLAVERKSIRIIAYRGATMALIAQSKEITSGYLRGIEEALDFIEDRLSVTQISGLYREEQIPYPKEIIREALVNSLVHQDFSIRGSGPLLELFSNRLQISNPGASLVDEMRIVDAPSISRNEALARLMRRLGLCEELGSGWDRMVLLSEHNLIPAPRIYTYQAETHSHTRVTIFSKVSYKDINSEERLWSTYLHACIKYITEQEGLTNSSLRKRFGLDDKSSATISRLIAEAIDKGWIKCLDPTTAKKHMRYIPYWA